MPQTTSRILKMSSVGFRSKRLDDSEVEPDEGVENSDELIHKALKILASDLNHYRH